jgi:alpha-L-fucosidase 2
MYPIVQFAPMHPTNLVNLDSPEATLQLARQTVWGQNTMSKWAPVNGLCLAWPAAAKLVDGAADPSSEFGMTTLLDAMESALNRTMQPNLWPSMNGGGVEQVGATQAVNDLLCQSVNGKIHLFPGWELGSNVSFRNIRTPGAFLVTASRSESGTVSGVRILSEVGGVCKLATESKPTVWTAAGGVAVAVVCDSVEHYCSFKTNPQATYKISV